MHFEILIVWPLHIQGKNAEKHI